MKLIEINPFLHLKASFNHRPFFIADLAISRWLMAKTLFITFKYERKYI